MAWISAAALVGGQLLSSGMGANAAQGASQAQVNASNAAMLLQNRQNNITAQAQAPYQQAGQEALGSLMGMMGLAAPKTTTPYGYTDAAQNTNMGNIYGLMGLGGNGNRLPPPPGRSTLDKLADPGNLAGSQENNLSDVFLGGAGLPGKGLKDIFGGLAHGGAAHGGESGGTYIVGEEGPEVLHMAPGSQGYVDPNPATKARMAMGHRALGGPVGRMRPTMPISPMGVHPLDGIGGGPFIPPYPVAPGYPMGNPMMAPHAPGFAQRALGGPVYGGSHTSAPWTPSQGFASHARLNPLAPTMHMGYMQEGSYKVPGRAIGGLVHGGASRTGIVAPNIRTQSNSTFQGAAPTESAPASAPAAAPTVSTPTTMTPDQIIAQDPGYQFRMDQGTKALDASAAAQGGLFSGAHGIGLEQYGQNYASQEYSNIWNRLASVAGIGQTAKSSAGYTGAMSASGAANSALFGGNAFASGLIGQNNAYQTGINNLSYLYGQGAFASPYQSQSGMPGGSQVNSRYGGG